MYLGTLDWVVCAACVDINAGVCSNLKSGLEEIFNIFNITEQVQLNVTNYY